jgi:hypothetical protein
MHGEKKKAYVFLPSHCDYYIEVIINPPILVGKNRYYAFKEIKERVIRKLNN